MLQLSVPTALRVELGQTGCPVAEGGPGAPTAAERRGRPLAERARLGDVLGRDPQGAAVGHRGPVVTPAGAGRVADERLVVGEAVVDTDALGRDADRAEPAEQVDPGIRGAREVVV